MSVVQYHSFVHEQMVHVGTDPAIGLAHMDGSPVFLSRVIILLFLDLFLSCFLSKLQKKFVTLVVDELEMSHPHHYLHC